jgi:hypothetical protein
VHKSVAQLLASGRVDALLAMRRAQFGDARMEDAPTPPPAPAPADQPRFTQADMNATVARETQAAQTKATTDLLAKLGYSSVEEAEQAAKAAKDAADALKSQQQRDADAAAEAKRIADAEKADAAREKHEARVERALSKAGLDLDNATLLRAGLAAIDLQPGADADAITAAVDKLKKDAPQLFGTATPTPGAPGSDPGTPRPTPAAPTGEFGSKGAAEAERRWGKKTA